MGSRRKSAKMRDPKQIGAIQRPGEGAVTNIPRLATRPAVQAALMLNEYGEELGDLDLTALIAMLAQQTEAVNDGDRGRTEGMLAAQPHALNAIFNTWRAGPSMWSTWTTSTVT